MSRAGYSARLIGAATVAILALLMAACSGGEPTDSPPPATASTTEFEPMPSLPPDSRITTDPLPVLLALEDPEGDSGPGYRYVLTRDRTVRGSSDDSLAGVVWRVEYDEPQGSSESLVILTVHPTPAIAEVYAQNPVRGVRCEGYSPLPQFSSTAMLCDRDEPMARVTFTVDEVQVEFKIHADRTETVLGVVESLFDTFQPMAEQVRDELTKACGHSGWWQTASTLLPSRSRTNAP